MLLKAYLSDEAKLLYAGSGIVTCGFLGCIGPLRVIERSGLFKAHRKCSSGGVCSSSETC